MKYDEKDTKHIKRSNAMKVQYISEVISEEERKGFRKGETVVVKSQVGTGKSTFSMDIAKSFLENGQRVLILVPRKLLKNQYEKALLDLFTTNAESSDEWFSNVEVRTYQEIECEMKISGGVIRKYYDLVIADEFHYFIDDAIFNENTIFSYDFLNKQKGALRILLSGTGERMQRFLSADQGLVNFNMNESSVKGEMRIVSSGGTGQVMLTYDLKTSYDDLRIRYLRSENEILPFLTCATGKSLVFVESKKQGQELQSKLEKMGICAKFLNAENKEKEAKECVEMLELSRKFNETVLISTSVLDAGVSLEDIEIKNVIICQMEKNTFLQMIGRVRRRMGVYHFELYLVSKTKKKLQRRIAEKNIKNSIFTVNRYRKKYESDTGIICPQWKVREVAKSIDQAETDKEIAIFEKFLYTYDGQQRVNKIMLAKMYCDNQVYNEYLAAIEKDSNGYLKTQLNWLGKQYDEENWVWKEKISELDNLLQEFWTTIRIVSKNVVLKGKDQKKLFLNFLLPVIKCIDQEYVINDAVSVDNFNAFCSAYNLHWNIHRNREKNKTMYELKTDICREYKGSKKVKEFILRLMEMDAEQNEELEE